ncbi:MAG TPA: alpha-glucan family phosphorylase [Terriglobales bacterium]|nr:alpha-glucan family phosphorylase [Terriglobales bacterium]
MNSISDPVSSKVAYFSMEIALDPAMNTYAGGLGMLAGDTLRAAADLGVPMVGITLLHRKGYFRQRLDPSGNQTEEPAPWDIEKFLEPVKPVGSMTIEGRPVQIRAWRFLIHGVSGHIVPVYLLDTQVAQNSMWDQGLTDFLYGGDDRYRLSQEAVLGLGAVDLLHALGLEEIETYHLNEGHAALLALALMEHQLTLHDSLSTTDDDVEAVRRKCVFTTHTPVPAGHDQFSRELIYQVLGARRAGILEHTGCLPDGALNMTYLALRFSRYINGVAMRHGEISRGMFPQYPVRAITNGVHAVTWTTRPFRALYDRHIPEWRHDNLFLRYAVGIPLDEIRMAHAEAKRALLDAVKQQTGIQLDEAVVTLGFARRASTYKRADLLFQNAEHLRSISRQVGPLQVIYGGKAHPRDDGGKALIRRVLESAASIRDAVRVVYVEDYGWHWAELLTGGVDLWLNTPQRPQEASGTSGMKAALNGVPSLSVLDGWWIEGHVEGVTGWAVGHDWKVAEDAQAEAASLYDKLELLILPMFYGSPNAYTEIMRSTIALNGSFFNAQRMLSQYFGNAYFPKRLAQFH